MTKAIPTKKTGNTPMRGIRVSEKLWNEAMATAQENEETVSAVIVRALRRYVKAGS